MKSLGTSWFSGVSVGTGWPWPAMEAREAAPNQGQRNQGEVCRVRDLPCAAVRRRETAPDTLDIISCLHHTCVLARHIGTCIFMLHFYVCGKVCDTAHACRQHTYTHSMTTRVMCAKYVPHERRLHVCTCVICAAHVIIGAT